MTKPTDKAKLEVALMALKKLKHIVARGGSFYQDGKRIIDQALAECQK